MKVRSRRRPDQCKSELQMTSMIDIVFLLLVFFIMTFKIVSLEGDFHVKMPRQQPAPRSTDDPLPPMTVRLVADNGGELAQIKLNDRNLGVSFDRLNQHLISLIGDDRGPDSLQRQATLEIDADYGLRYEHVIHAITAVSGFTDADGNTVGLVQRIRFTQPRAT